MRAAIMLVAMACGLACAVEEPLAILSPRPHQVVQWNAPAPIRLRGSTDGATWRVVPLAGAWGTATTWAALPAEGVRIPAGGWYRLEVRRGGRTAVVDPIGSGEVFIVAGQSYADNCSDEQLQVAEAHGRVSAFDMTASTWRIAHDPQPNAVSPYRRGSIWPAFGDGLAQACRRPVGLINVAKAATSSEQWMPGTELHRNLVAAAQAVGAFRAVLWQQGESDVIATTTSEVYVQRLTAIRASLVTTLGREIPWMAAQSTIHPAIYRKPDQEAVIRSAIATLWRTPGFLPGPDTDTLTGDNRSPAQSSQHFTAIGQRRAAALWVTAVQPLVTAAAAAGTSGGCIDRLRAGTAQTIVLYGTSLTADAAWGGLLQRALDERFPRLATVVNAGLGGKWSQWGLDNLEERVLRRKPDAVFIEFAINDAYTPYKTTVADCRRNLDLLIDRIIAGRPACQVVLLTMNQPTGPHLDLRPDFSRYYEVYRQVARERRLLLIDLLPAWERLRQQDAQTFAALVPDGIHPGAEGSTRVTLPGILAGLGIDH